MARAAMLICVYHGSASSTCLEGIDLIYPFWKKLSHDDLASFRDIARKDIRGRRKHSESFSDDEIEIIQIGQLGQRHILARGQAVPDFGLRLLVDVRVIGWIVTHYCIEGSSLF